jgi:hypothetical protein
MKGKKKKMTTPFSIKRKITEKDFEKLRERISDLEGNERILRVILSFHYWSPGEEESDVLLSAEDFAVILELKTKLENVNEQGMTIYLEQAEFMCDEAFKLKHDMDYWQKEIILFKAIYNFQLQLILTDIIKFEVLIPLQVIMGHAIEMLVRSVRAKKNGEEVGHAGGIMQGWLSSLFHWVKDNLIAPIVEFVV